MIIPSLACGDGRVRLCRKDLRPLDAIKLHVFSLQDARHPVSGDSMSTLPPYEVQCDPSYRF